MSWRDNSSSSTNGTQDGSGGSMSGGGSVSGTGGGGFGGMRGQTTGDRGSYTFRGVPGSRNIVNWNTGGPVVGTGSIMGGIQPAPAVALPRAHPRPTGFMQTPMVPPAIPIPRPNPWTDIGVAIDYFDAQNPNGLFAPSTEQPPVPGSKLIQDRIQGGSSYPGQQPSYSPSGDAYSRGWGVGETNGNRNGRL